MLTQFIVVQIFLTLIGFGLGACLYACIAIFGIVASESYPAHLSGTAHAFVALAANGNHNNSYPYGVYGQLLIMFSVIFSGGNFVWIALQLHRSNIQLARDIYNTRNFSRCSCVIVGGIPLFVSGACKEIENPVKLPNNQTVVMGIGFSTCFYLIEPYAKYNSEKKLEVSISSSLMAEEF